MINRIELLAPAGNSESLHAAVENGADAVYLGGKLFNARQQADNFDMQMLREELRYSHARGVSIYLTLNTLLNDNEIKQAVAYAEEACEAGIDGIIVQDTGLAAELRRAVPEMPLHGSTQMTVYDLGGVRALEDMGFQRVVLARELTLEQASQIARNTELEVEMFVHGALCVCYSGQCLMSSMIGGRSGNRGRCAQPCRLPYRLIDIEGRLGRGIPSAGKQGADRAIRDKSDRGKSGANKAGTAKQGTAKQGTAYENQAGGYLLSPRDICSIELLPQIAASGIKSLKIEGRMKGPEYVATVVRIYRKYLDMTLEQADKGMYAELHVDGKDKHDLLQIFNRGGFSAGYLNGKSGADMMSWEKPNNSGVFIGKVSSYDRLKHTISITLEDRLSVGDGIEIWTGGLDSPGGTVSGIRTYGRNSREANKGATSEIGSFRGRISPGDKVYKTTDAELNKTARGSYIGRNIKRISINGKAILKTGRPLELFIDDGDGHLVSAAGTVLPEAAVNKPMTEERLKKQLEKTGSTPFIFSELTVDLEDGLSIPVSEINEVRRQALDMLYDERAQWHPGRICNSTEMDAGSDDAADENSSVGDLCGVHASVISTEEKLSRPLISLYFYRWHREMDLGGFGADRLYVPVSAIDRPGFTAAVRSARRSGAEIFCWVPPITAGNYNKILERLIGKYSRKSDDLNDIGIDGFLAANIGTLHRLRDIQGLRLAGDISLNLYNAYSVRRAVEFGLESAALSVELTIKQIFGLVKNIRSFSDISLGAYGSDSDDRLALEAAVYGRLPLMTSEYCPVGSVKGGFSSSSKCTGCCSRGDYVLQDRLDMEFPVLCDNIDCRSSILNSNVLFVPDSVGGLVKSGINILRFYIWDEDHDTVRDLVRLYRASASGDHEEAAAFGKLVDRIKASGFTKGHYYRGV